MIRPGVSIFTPQSPALGRDTRRFENQPLAKREGRGETERGFLWATLSSLVWGVRN